MEIRLRDKSSICRVDDGRRHEMGMIFDFFRMRTPTERQEPASRTRTRPGTLEIHSRSTTTTRHQKCRPSVNHRYRYANHALRVSIQLTCFQRAVGRMATAFLRDSTNVLNRPRGCRSILEVGRRQVWRLLDTTKAETTPGGKKSADGRVGYGSGRVRQRSKTGLRDSSGISALVERISVRGD